MTAPEARDARPPRAQRRIVVGVDGSAGGSAALRWATENAARLDAVVEAVLVYAPAPALVFAPGGAGALAVLGGDEDVAASAAGQLAAAIDEVGGRGRVRGNIVRSGHAWQALTESSADALLLVVGHHRRRGIDVVAGSTARACLQHAHCPVLVVPDEMWEAAR